MVGASNASAVAVGIDYVCIKTVAGTAQCWGSNASGQLGNGTTTSSDTPVTVANLTGVAGIGSGFRQSCARLTDGTVWCWGINTYGGLGDGSTATSAVPVEGKW
jgi:alpha-tubulin suppressor-like RCC1 family protein